MVLGDYNPKEIEEKWRKYWEDKKIYKFNPKTKKKIYSIDTPPPTVSGEMHIGHAFSYSQQDFIARFHRMKSGIFYPFGTDDNGLPTERLIEKLKGVKSKSMSREEFIKLCLKTLKEITSDFIDDWKRLGISADYGISYSTIDENSRKISQLSFIELYKKNQIYKKSFPTLWCPECQTAIAQAELEDKSQESKFTTLKFHANGKELPIATTRPELLPACVAVFINSKDKRYKSLVGKKAKVPLFNFEVPIIEDKSAKIEKGTGVLMICSYGDKFDADAIQRHKLTPRVIINPEGTLNIPGYEGLKIKQAREKILQELQKSGSIKEQKLIQHIVNVHDKCGTEIEFLPTEQWFVKILDKKQKLIAQGKRIKWHPDFMFKRYENWVKGLEWDWSISRDRHFGVPIPVWNCKKCNEIILPEKYELPVDPMQLKKSCPKCHQEALPETKVLDTWATSSLTPQIASSLIGNKIIIPYSLRPQAHDIIRTWAFYTITKSYLQENKIPWNNIMVSGFVTLKGEKMSKSKGNIIKPQEILEKFSADALRYWAAGSKLGEDLDYQEQDLLSGKKFATKLLNASKFVFMNLEDYKNQIPKKFEKIDELFLANLKQKIKKITEHFENYEYQRAVQEFESLFWKDFTDNYLEIVKFRIYNSQGDKKISAQYALYNSLLNILKLISPITPFITEHIYQEYFKKTEKTESIHLCSWPELKISKKEIIQLDKWGQIIKILTKVRQEKSTNKKSMKSEIILTLEKSDLKNLKEMLDDLKSVINSKKIKEGKFKVEFI